MQLVPLLLVAVVMAVDEGLRPLGAQWGLSHVSVSLLALGPIVLILLAAQLVVAWCGRRFSMAREKTDPRVRSRRSLGIRPIIAADRMIRLARALIVVNHLAAVLVFDWVGTVRSCVGDVILLDELVAILPPLAGLMGTWWVHYPIDRRLREAMLVGRLDDGRPIHPTPSRFHYVLLQTRLHLLLLLVPVLLIAGASELIDYATALSGKPLSNQALWLSRSGTLAAAAIVFLFAPVLARLVLDVRPIPPGELRQSLLAICARHRVKVRELLLWNTNGSMINAAVMGLIGPLRYVLITDALLEMLREDQIRAVMAHEIGHVRRHHMPWLLACLMAAFILAVPVIEVPLLGIEAIDVIHSPTMVEVVWMSANIAQLAIGLMLFGWVCRRLERQADTFAVQHLSGLGESRTIQDSSSSTTGSEVRPITMQAVDSMRGALDAIARLNTIDPRRSSWRHGSIAWRIEYLFSIIGRPLTNVPIDRVVRVIKIATIVVLAGAVGYEVFMASRWTASEVDSTLDQRQSIAGKIDDSLP